MTAAASKFNIPDGAAEFAREAFGPVVDEPIQAVDRAALEKADHTRKLERCLQYLPKVDNAVSGAGGHNALLWASRVCVRFDLDEQEHQQALQWFSVNKSDPPWSAREIDHKVNEARRLFDTERGLLLVNGGSGKTKRHESRAEAPGLRIADDLTQRTTHYTDIGNAARFALDHKGSAFWCGAHGCWYVWTGKRWERDESEAVVGMAKQTALNIVTEALREQDESKRKQLLEHGAKSQRRERISAMIALARDDMAVTPDELDADPFAFNCNNGTLGLRTNELRPHNPADLITKLAPVDYHPEAECPMFLAFLTRIFDGDVDLIGFIQRFCGYSLTGDISDPIMAVMYGQGANGKSTLLEIIGYCMGDYAGLASAELFTVAKTGASEQRYELAEIAGNRLIVASESERNRRLKVALVKAMTGDERIKCRAIYGKPFSYKRTFKPVLVTNHKPLVDEDNEAVWRRVRLIPFNVTIPKAERDTKLPAKLRREVPGILAWLVRGCRDWQRDGLTEPDAVTAATNQYRAESDPLAGFLADCCVMIPNAWTRTADLRKAYERYTEEQGDRPVGGRTFTESLTRNGCKPDRIHAGRGWRGVGLLESGGEA